MMVAKVAIRGVFSYLCVIVRVLVLISTCGDRRSGYEINVCYLDAFIVYMCSGKRRGHDIYVWWFETWS